MSDGTYPGEIAARTPDRAAYIMAGTGEVVTYRQLDAAANRLSRVFYEHGLRPGDHVAFCMENHPRYLEVAWGAHYAGLIYTACSSRLLSDELAYIVDDCEAKAFITSTYKADQAVEIVADTPKVQLRLMLDGTVPGYDSYEDAVAPQPAEPLPDRREGADMLYSSGTTGRPKGVKVPRVDAPLGSVSPLVLLITNLFGFADDAVYLSPAPLYHSAPLRFNMAVQRLGGTGVIMEHFDAEQFLALVEKYRVTCTQVVPTMFIRMLKLPDEVRRKYDVSSLQSVVHAAAPCPVDVKRQMIEWWGPVIHEYYAGTEGNGFVYVGSQDWLTHPGTVGRAILGTMHILDDEGDEMPAGEPGTIYFEGGGEFEYHNDAEKTASSRNTKGWSTLGDVGYLDDEGYLYLTDRKAFMIISGGVNIYPQEAENVLVGHPKVADVAVFGVPNADFGEEVKAVIQPTDMADAGPDLERELIDYCRERLADVKCPRTIDFREELPRHPTGKLYKRLLKDEYWAGHGQSRIL
jgi:acyl-CoA synthetase (AMP-forming)/AMP-acid ligase II